MTDIETAPERKHGPALRLVSTISPGVRRIRDQIGDFERRWTAHNNASTAGQPCESPWVLLGDSLSQGIGASNFTSTWPLRLLAEYKQAAPKNQAALLNLSRSGARITDVRRIQLRSLDQCTGDPRLITVTIGSNDLMRSFRLRRTFDLLDTFLSELAPWSERGTRVVVATIPDRGSAVARRFNGRLRSIAPEHGVEVAEIGSQATLDRHQTAADRFHPNDRGYETWVKGFRPMVCATE